MTIFSDSSLFFFISGHYDSRDSYIYYPLFKILSLFGWIHHCTTMLCFSVGLNSFFMYIIRHCLKPISYNGVSLKQRFYFLPIHHFRLVRPFFMMHQHLISNILLWLHFSSINIWEPSYESILNISVQNTIKFTHAHFHNFYFIGYHCYYMYICYFLNNIYHKQFIFFYIS